MQNNIVSIVLALLVTLFLGPVLPGGDRRPQTIQPPPVAQNPGGPIGGLPVPNPANGEKMVLGYFVDGSGPRSSITSMRNNIDGITDISGFWYTFDTEGKVYGKPNQTAMDTAGGRGIGVYPLIHNIQQGKFSKKLANTVLSSPTKRRNLVSGIAGLAWSQGVKGVVIDIEDIYPSDRPLFEGFLRELRAAVGYRKEIIVAVPAKTRDDWRSNWIGGYDYSVIGEIADALALMTYDEHSFGSGPGPVASQEWTEKVVKYAVSKVPPGKVLLGLAGYGYHWVNGNTKKAVIHAEVVQLSDKYGAPTQWSDAHGTPYLRYTDEMGRRNEVWFENHNSIGRKLGLVGAYGLRGVALWRLGQEDQRIWRTLDQGLPG